MGATVESEPVSKVQVEFVSSFLGAVPSFCRFSGTNRHSALNCPETGVNVIKLVVAKAIPPQWNKNAATKIVSLFVVKHFGLINPPTSLALQGAGLVREPSECDDVLKWT